jgi:membrane-associated phospholipid phosphatase
MVPELPGSSTVNKRWIAAFVFFSALILVVVSYNYWDIPLALYCKGLSRSALDIAETVTIAGESKWYYLLFVPAYVVFRFMKKNELWANRFLFLLIAISASGLINILIKWLAGRRRPVNLFNGGQFGFDYFKIVYESTSCPSGHSVTAFTLAAAISIFAPRWSLPVFAAAVAIAMSRVLITSHYLSDVIAGAGIGILCVLAVKYFFNRFHVKLDRKEIFT